MLITCPECGRQISDTAMTCPHCGFYRGKKCHDCEYFYYEYDEENGPGDSRCRKRGYVDANSPACNQFVIDSYDDGD